MQEDIGMEKNGLSEVTASPKPHKKNTILQKHKVMALVCILLLLLLLF